MTQMNLSMKEKQTHIHRKQICGCQGGGEVEGWIEILGLADANLYIEWKNNKVLQYSTGNYIQYPVINHNGKEYEKECVYMYKWISLLCSRN